MSGREGKVSYLLSGTKEKKKKKRRLTHRTPSWDQTNRTPAMEARNFAAPTRNTPAVEARLNLGHLRERAGADTGQDVVLLGVGRLERGEGVRVN